MQQTHWKSINKSTKLSTNTKASCICLHLEDKHYRIVLRNLHHSSSHDEIITALQELGHTMVNVTGGSIGNSKVQQTISSSSISKNSPTIQVNLKLSCFKHSSTIRKTKKEINVHPLHEMLLSWSYKKQLHTSILLLQMC